MTLPQDEASHFKDFWSSWNLHLTPESVSQAIASEAGASGSSAAGLNEEAVIFGQKQASFLSNLPSPLARTRLTSTRGSR